MVTSKKKFDLVSVTYEGWDTIMEAASYDSDYDEDTKRAIWKAIEETQYISGPWISIEIKDGIPAKARLFRNQENAIEFSKNARKKLSKKSQIFCLEIEYQRTSPKTG